MVAKTMSKQNNKKSSVIHIGKPTVSDKLIMWSRSQPLTAEQLSGFGKVSSHTGAKKGTQIYPFIKFLTPDKEDGYKGYGVMIGIKGSF